MASNILTILWLSAAVALVFWLFHYIIAGWLAAQPPTKALGQAIATFFPGT